MAPNNITNNDNDNNNNNNNKVIIILTDVLLDACKDIGLAVNTGKTKYMEIGHQRGMIANEHIRIGKSLGSFSDESKF